MTTYERAEAAVSSERIDHALAHTRREPYWLDTPERPDALPAARGALDTDLLVVGGGYTGLWTALLAKERNPDRRVIILEGQRIGWAASGRNGGFCEASLTHGASNGERHLPKESARLHDLGLENIREFGDTVRRYNMDCDWSETGVLRVASEPYQGEILRAEAAAHEGSVYFDAAAVRTEVNSPVYHGALWEKEGNVLVHPAKLAWELLRVCRELGVEVFEHSQASAITAEPDAITVTTAAGASIRASRVALASNVFPNLLKRARPYTVPVWDFALMSNPLSAEQSAALGWANDQGLADMNNRFHYIRKTRGADGLERILFGGYDALYHYGKGLKDEYYNSEPTYRRLVAHFYETFPVLGDIGFSHAWGGAIDSCSRFFSFFTRAHQDRVVSVTGFTGLGVGATRFGANAMLDILDGLRTERTELDLVKKKPIPFPPEPIAALGVRITTAEMARSDRRQGKRGLWLSTMDAVGMGFDS